MHFHQTISQVFLCMLQLQSCNSLMQTFWHVILVSMSSCVGTDVPKHACDCFQARWMEFSYGSLSSSSVPMLAYCSHRLGDSSVWCCWEEFLRTSSSSSFIVWSIDSDLLFEQRLRWISVLNCGRVRVNQHESTEKSTRMHERSWLVPWCRIEPLGSGSRHSRVVGWNHTIQLSGGRTPTWLEMRVSYFCRCFSISSKLCTLLVVRL